MRDPYKFDLYKFKTKTDGYNSLMYERSKLWNSMPVDVKRSPKNT